MTPETLPVSPGLAPPREATPGLLFSDVAAAYGDRSVLRDVRAAIAPRKITALVGPSGGGKTTLVRVASRTLELTPGARLVSGRVLLNGNDLYAEGRDPRGVRRAVGLIQQRPVAFPMSILDNVLFGASFHGLLGAERPLDYAERYLLRAGLWNEVKDRLRAPAASLSGGQLQRLCIARTLANRPEVILLDEPTSSLDPHSTSRIEDHLRELKSDLAVAFVTHDLRQARRLADDVLFIAGGRLVESATSTDFFASPKTAEAAAYLNDSPS